MERDVEDAIDYFWTSGFIEQMSRDERYYVEALIRFAGKELGIPIN
tara:strand:- start:7574 stop:7711 length:138 start_codon:yes stop_codon:yes gene_type:complete